jgi:diguanylate cyclase (GGDEF)-like protein/PAS domain S-box-containing protein
VTEDLLEIFDREHAAHLSREALEDLFARMVRAYPDSPVTPLAEAGVVVPIPASMKLERNPVVEVRAATDAIVFEAGLLTAWDKALTQGVAKCKAHPIGHPDVAIMLYMMDLRESHGVLASVAVYFEDVDEIEAAAARQEWVDAPPRFATIRKDSRSNIMAVDEAITRILGWSAEELIGRPTIDFIHPDDHKLAVDNFVQMMSSPDLGRRVRLRHRRSDDSYVWLEVTNHNRIDDPEHKCIVAEMVDISEEMAAHEELRAREQLLDRLAATVPVGLFQVDGERRVVYTNERLHEILGLERQATAAQQLACVVEDDQPSLHRALDQVLADASEADVEVRLRLTGDRQLRFCTVSLRALSHDDGTVSGAIACVADVTDSARMREELKQRATFDDLTGCYNRPSIMLALEANIESGRGDRAVVFVDVDRFKAVNDEYGHAVGDELLRTVANQLRAGVRDDDMVGRIGGDEFLVMCPNIGGAERAMKLAKRLAGLVRRESIAGAAGVAPRVSVGVAWSEGDTVGADTLVARADAAMYESKRQGAGEPSLARAA